MPGITPAKINADFNVPTGNENIVVVGYGATEEGGSMSSTFQEVTLNNVPYSECVDVYGSDELDRDTMFCAGVDGGGVSRK